MAEGSADGRDRSVRQRAALTVLLALLILGANAYVYASSARLDPLSAGLTLPHLYYLALLCGCARGYPWAVWGVGSACSFAYAAVWGSEGALGLSACLFALAGGLTAAAAGRFRHWRESREEQLRRLDAVNAEAQKRLDERSALFEVAREVSRTFDIERLFSDVMALLSEQLNMRRGQLLLYDRAAGAFSVKHAYGLTAADAQRSRYRLAEKAYRRVLETGVPTGVPNLGEELPPLPPGPGEAEPSVAALCVPIVMEGEDGGGVERGPGADGRAQFAGRPRFFDDCVVGVCAGAEDPGDDRGGGSSGASGGGRRDVSGDGA